MDKNILANGFFCVSQKKVSHILKFEVNDDRIFGCTTPLRSCLIIFFFFTLITLTEVLMLVMLVLRTTFSHGLQGKSLKKKKKNTAVGCQDTKGPTNCHVIVPNLFMIGEAQREHYGDSTTLSRP